jgi:hypothetical protein
MVLVQRNMVLVQQIVVHVEQMGCLCSRVPVQQNMHTNVVPVQQHQVSVQQNMHHDACTADSGPVLVALLRNLLSLQPYKSCRFFQPVWSAIAVPRTI